MKINNLILSVFILGFLALNIFSFKDFLYLSFWNYAFKNKDFSWALDKFEKVNSFDWYYDKLNTDYRLWDYNTWVLEEVLNCTKWNNCFLFNHNLWNTYFRLSEEKNSFEEKQSLLNSSIESYLKALDIKYDFETEKNLEFAKQNLDDLRNQEEESQEQENQDSEDNNQTKDSSQSSSTSWENTEENWEDSQDSDSENKNISESWDNQSDSSNSSSNKSWENAESAENSSWLSESEKKSLDQYSKALEEAQWDFWKYYNKVYQDSRNPVDEFETFFWTDPFFDNTLLNWRNNVKDW